MNEPVSAITEVQCFRIGGEAVITINQTTGMVIVSTCRHRELNGMTFWCHRGDATLIQFLITSSADYVIGKLFQRHQLQEFDAEGTIKDIQDWIISLRRDSGPGGESPTASQAREWWDEVHDIVDPEDLKPLDFLGDEWYEFIRQKDTSAVRYFEQVIWAPFIAHLKTL